MLLHCDRSSVHGFLMKHAPIQWLNVWKGSILSPLELKGEKYIVYNYSSYNLCPLQKNTLIHIDGLSPTKQQSSIQVYGATVNDLHTRDKTSVKIMTDKKQMLATLISMWTQTDIDEEVEKEVNHILGLSDGQDMETWISQAYQHQMTYPTSIRSKLANVLNGDSRSIVELVLTVLYTGRTTTHSELTSVISSVKFEPWITDVLKEDEMCGLFEREIPEWLKPKRKEEDRIPMGDPQESSEPHSDDKIAVWEVLQQIKDKTLIAENRWKAYISLHLLFDILVPDEDNIARTRSALKSLAKGIPVHFILHMVAKWLNSADGEPLAPKQLELILSDIHRLISEDPIRDLNIRLLFLPWLIPPFLKTSLPHHRQFWDRLQLKTFDMFGMVYGTGHTISDEFMSYWKKSGKYLSMSVSKYDKSKIEPRKWFALYADCYVAQLHYLANHVFSSHPGSTTEKRFVQLVEQREDEFEKTRDSSPTGILIKTLMKEQQNQKKITQHPSLIWYIPRECLAVYIEKTSYVWYWMAYHYKKKVPGWLTPCKLQFIDYKKKTDHQKIQTMILEQLLETMEHSLSFDFENIAFKVISKHPVTIKQVRDTLSEMIKHESKALDWLPNSMQKTLGLRKLQLDGRFTLRDPHVINSVISEGFRHIKDRHENNAEVDDRDWQQIVQSLPFLPDETQQTYVRRMIKEPVCILKGPPGCGKTATLHLFNQVAKHLRWSVVYLGPTGRSVTRMSQLIPGLKALLRDGENERILGIRPTDQVCMTLDRAVFPMASAFISLFKPDVIVIDETSMVNSITAAKLLFLLSQYPPSTKLIMVGDPEQLFPVEAGSFFEQCIKSQTMTTFSLTKIYRQSAIKLLQTCQNILNYQPNHSFEQIVLHDPNSIADCTAINGRERVKADEYKKMAISDYRRSCSAIKSDVLARKFICPRTQGRLGVVEMNFMAQSVWQSVGTPIFPIHFSSGGGNSNGPTLTTNNGKTYTYGNTKERIELKDDQVEYSNQRGVIKKWLSYTKKPKNGENIQSADWATLALGNAAKVTDLDSGEFCLMPGDPIMCHSEVRGTGLTNGDECVIAGWINSAQMGQYALLLDNIRNVFVTIKMHILFKQFAPSYCITAHKSQGGEYPHVFICMPWVDAEETIGLTPKYPYYRLLTKRLLYTSITRTKNICTLYGWRHAYRLCMEDRYSEDRVDFLSSMLGEQ